MSLITTAWSIVYELLFEYAFFLPLDLWTKLAIGRVRNQAEWQHIWSSEAELLIIASFLIWLWWRTFPFLLLILAYTTFIFSRGLTLKLGLLETATYLKYAIWYIIFILWSIIYKIWFVSSINLGNIITLVFQKIFGESNNNKEIALEGFLTTFGNYVRTFLLYFLNLIIDFCNRIYKSILLWIDLFGNSPWDVYSSPPMDCLPTVPAYFTTTFPSREQLLCHPDCELSQRSGIYSGPVTYSTNNLDHSSEHTVSTESYSTYTKDSHTTSIHSIIISYFIYFMSQLSYASVGLCKSIYYLFVEKTHSNQLLPPGLKNMGQNTCYFNAVLQCFVRTPGIVGTLEGVLAAEALARLHITEAEAQFLHAFRELMLQLSTWTVSDKVLEEFQFYCSTLVPTLVSYLHPTPVQQDASEFVMWLLNKLHECFNTRRDQNYTSVRIRLKRFPILLGVDCGYPLWKTSEQRSNYFMTTNLPENTVERLLQLADEEWDSYERNNASPVSALFTSQTVEVHRCLGCDQLSAQTQIFTILPLAFSSNCDEVALSDLVSKFFSVEEVDTNASMQCTCGLPYNRLNNFTPVGNRPSQCGSVRIDGSGIINTGMPVPEHRGAKTSTPVTVSENFLLKCNPHGKSNSLSQLVSPIGSFVRSPVSVNEDFFSPFKQETLQTVPCKKWVKQTFLCKAPKCLVMQLMRFYYDADKRISLKTHQAVDIPLSNLEVPVLRLGSKKHHENSQTSICRVEYELYGLIVHLGTQSTTSGHYVAYCCDRDLNKQTVWYKFDDEIVTRINTLEELNSIHVKRNAYLLFYKQRDAQYLSQETSFRQRGRF